MQLTDFLGILVWWFTAMAWCSLPVFVLGFAGVTWDMVKVCRGKSTANGAILGAQAGKILGGIILSATWLLAKGCAT